MLSTGRAGVPACRRCGTAFPGCRLDRLESRSHSARHHLLPSAFAHCRARGRSMRGLTGVEGRASAATRASTTGRDACPTIKRIKNADPSPRPHDTRRWKPQQNGRHERMHNVFRASAAPSRSAVLSGRAGSPMSADRRAGGYAIAAGHYQRDVVRLFNYWNRAALRRLPYP